MEAVSAETIDSSRHTGVVMCRRELCVSDEVLFVHGLLDEEQGELVELGEVSNVSSSVCGVRVHLKHQLAPEAVPGLLPPVPGPSRAES